VLQASKRAKRGPLERYRPKQSQVELGIIIAGVAYIYIHTCIFISSPLVTELFIYCRGHPAGSVICLLKVINCLRALDSRRTRPGHSADVDWVR
jgi:hypothetical protein